MMKFDDKSFIAKKIKIHRKNLGLTQEQLAEMVDLSVQHVSRIENGCYIPSLKTFFMLVDILNIDLREFGFDVNKNKNNLIENLINEITNATNTELIFYENLIKTVKSTLSKIKKDNL